MLHQRLTQSKLPNQKYLQLRQMTEQNIWLQFCFFLYQYIRSFFFCPKAQIHTYLYTFHQFKSVRVQYHTHVRRLHQNLAGIMPMGLHKPKLPYPRLLLLLSLTPGTMFYFWLYTHQHISCLSRIIFISGINTFSFKRSHMFFLILEPLEPTKNGLVPQPFRYICLQKS